jgi:hypothetical protein
MSLEQTSGVYKIWDRSIPSFVHLPSTIPLSYLTFVINGNLKSYIRRLCLRQGNSEQPIVYQIKPQSIISIFSCRRHKLDEI